MVLSPYNIYFSLWMNAACSVVAAWCSLLSQPLYNLLSAGKGSAKTIRIPKAFSCRIQSWQTITFIPLALFSHLTFAGVFSAYWVSLKTDGRAVWMMGYLPACMAVLYVATHPSASTKLAILSNLLGVSSQQVGSFASTMYCSSVCLWK